MSRLPALHVSMSMNNDTTPVGRLSFTPAKGAPIPSFEYDSTWLKHPMAFEIDPEAPMTPGRHFPSKGFFCAIGDSAPDKWGREIMRRRERRHAEAESRQVKTLFEHDYLIGVADIPRMGGIRFAYEGSSDVYQTPLGEQGVPTLIHLQDLFDAAGRIDRGEETDADITLLFCQGSSLGGARPKASIKNNDGDLCIAKFPKNDDEYSMERWESIALTLAEMAGINTSRHKLVKVLGKDILLSTRFDRQGDIRIPFMSAMAKLQAQDGATGSYLDLVDEISSHGSRPAADRRELFKRVAFSILISNVDDHLRNHGFLLEAGGWILSPLYDVNPVPVDLKPRILSTAIDESETSCSLSLLIETVEFYSIDKNDAKTIITEVANSVRKWREVAKKTGASDREIERMASAFEHSDMALALQLADK